MSTAKHDYHSITEYPGLGATRDQLERLCHRYRFALEYADSRDVLEVACGSGIGMGYLAKRAGTVVGGDIDQRNITIARSLYTNSAAKICNMDAHYLPFKNATFGLVLLFEAIYYLGNPELCLNETKRVLRESGVLIICTVNKELADFHPSPYAQKYFSSSELYGLLKNKFARVELYGAFPNMESGHWSHCLSTLKRIAVYFNLIPGSLKARSYLKRLFFGSLIPLPDQIREGMAAFKPPILIKPDSVNMDFKIIYAVAKK